MLTAVSEDKECSQESQYTPLSQFFIDVVEQGPAQLLGERPLQRFAGLGLDPHRQTVSCVVVKSQSQGLDIQQQFLF